MCIKENPKVLVLDFIDVVEDELVQRNLKSLLYSNTKPSGCEFTLEYTALRSWDLKPFMTMARIKIKKDDLIVGSVRFDQASGLGFSKFEPTVVKLRPVFKELFGENKKLVK